MKPEIGLGDEERESVIDILNTVLADEVVLYQELRNYHWNVKGVNFFTLHETFEDQYTELERVIDEVAERVTALGGNALGTLTELKEKSGLDEREGEYPDAETMVEDLMRDHETVIANLREAQEKCEEHGAVEDQDLLIGLIETHSEMAWMLRSFLE